MILDLAHLTGDLPGIGGVIKQRPEDFFVEELPLYEPTGTGEHLMICVEKCGVTTSDIVRQLAKAFRVSRSDIGYAGLKDKRAVVRQHFTVYLPDASHDQQCLERIQYTQARLLWSKRHENKLRRGHLTGNRFVIYIRQVDPTAAVAAKRVIERLLDTGVPNYIGEQRFGYRGTNDQLGKLLLLGRWQIFCDLLLGGPRDGDFPRTRAGREAYDRGDYLAALEVWPRYLRYDRQVLDALRQGKSPMAAALVFDQQQRSFLISACQSTVFNHVLDRRLGDGLLGALMEGDLAWKHDSRAVFAVDRITAERENGSDGRAGKMEVSPSGPMWGAAMTRPSGQVLQWEREALAHWGLTEADWDANEHFKAEGGRRPMRTFIANPDVSGGVDEHGSYVRLAFDLSRGSFATVVLRELMKTGL